MVDHVQTDTSVSARSIQIGVVGLGHMGHAFACNLLEDGYRVHAYDRDAARVASLKGATSAAKLTALADCGVVITSLPDDGALASVALGTEGLINVLAPGAIHVSMSTVSPDISRRVAEAHAQRKQAYVAAPILGNPDMARDRKVFVLAAAPATVLERVRPVLDRLGQRTFIVADDPGLANLMKLAANVLTATTLECMGEVLALMRKAGVDSQLTFNVLTNSLFDSRVHKTYGGKIVAAHYSPPGMTTQLALKDLRLALAEAEHSGVPMPAATLVREHLEAMIARGWDKLDWSALGLLAAVAAGINDDAQLSEDGELTR